MAADLPQAIQRQWARRWLKNTAIFVAGASICWFVCAAGYQSPTNETPDGALELSSTDAATALVALAQEAASQDSRAVAEFLASYVLQYADDPVARGVFAEVSSGPQPTLLSTLSLSECQRISASRR